MAHLEDVVAESVCGLPEAFVELLLIYGLQSTHVCRGSGDREHEALACGEEVADALSREVVVHDLRICGRTCEKLGIQHVNLIEINNFTALQKLLNETIYFLINNKKVVLHYLYSDFN